MLLVYKFLSVLKKKCENNFGRNVIYVQPLRGPGAAFQSKGLKQLRDRRTDTSVSSLCVESYRNRSPISRPTALSLYTFRRRLDTWERLVSLWVKQSWVYGDKVKLSLTTIRIIWWEMLLCYCLIKTSSSSSWGRSEHLSVFKHNHLIKKGEHFILKGLVWGGLGEYWYSLLTAVLGSAVPRRRDKIQHEQHASTTN